MFLFLLFHPIEIRLFTPTSNPGIQKPKQSRRKVERLWPSTTPLLTPCPVHCRPSSGQPHTSPPDCPWAEHWRVSKHVGNNEKPYVATSYVNLIKMRNATVTGCNGDVFELYVHVVLSFYELATENLTWGQLEGANVALSLIEQLDWNTDTSQGRHVFVVVVE